MENRIRRTHCPQCEGPMRVLTKKCDHCQLEMKADYDESPLTTLQREEQDFLLQFVLVAGNLKALGEKLNLSYPTLRSRLDKIIVRLEEAAASQDPNAILDAIDDGRLSPEDALLQLRKINRKGEVA